MGKIVAKKDTTFQSWARLRLDNGDQVMISVAQSGVKVFKMKWAGMVPAATLWESKSIAEVGETFFNPDKPLQRPLDSMIEHLIDCGSASEVVVRLTRKPGDIDAREVLQRYGKTLQQSAQGLIRDVSELPYPKDMIEVVLRDCLKVGKGDQQTLDTVGTAYLSLAYFQPLTDQERKAVAVMGGSKSRLSPRDLAKQIREVGEAYRAVMKRVGDEQERIGKELGLRTSGRDS